MYFLIFFSVYFFYILSIFTVSCSFTDSYTKILDEIKSHIKSNNAVPFEEENSLSSFGTSNEEHILVQAMFLINSNYQKDVDLKHIEYTKKIQLNLAKRLMQKFGTVELGIAKYHNWLSLQDSDYSCYSLSLPLTSDFNRFKKTLDYTFFFNAADKAEPSLMTLKYAAIDRDIRWKSQMIERLENGSICKTLKLIFIFPAFAPVLNKPFSHLINYGDFLNKDPVCECRIEDMPSCSNVNEILNRQNIIPIIVTNTHYGIDEYWNIVMNDLDGLKLSFSEDNSEQFLLSPIQYLVKSFKEGKLHYNGGEVYRKFGDRNVTRFFKKIGWKKPVPYNLCSSKRIDDKYFRYQAICSANLSNWSEPSCSGILCTKREFVEWRNGKIKGDEFFDYVAIYPSKLSHKTNSVEEINKSLLSCSTFSSAFSQDSVLPNSNNDEKIYVPADSTPKTSHAPVLSITTNPNSSLTTGLSGFSPTNKQKGDLFNGSSTLSLPSSHPSVEIDKSNKLNKNNDGSFLLHSPLDIATGKIERHDTYNRNHNIVTKPQTDPITISGTSNATPVVATIMPPTPVATEMPATAIITIRPTTVIATIMPPTPIATTMTTTAVVTTAPITGAVTNVATLSKTESEGRTNNVQNQTYIPVTYKTDYKNNVKVTSKISIFHQGNQVYDGKETAKVTTNFSNSLNNVVTTENRLTTGIFDGEKNPISSDLTTIGTYTKETNLSSSTESTVKINGAFTPTSESPSTTVEINRKTGILTSTKAESKNLNLPNYENTYKGVVSGVVNVVVISNRKNNSLASNESKDGKSGDATIKLTSSTSSEGSKTEGSKTESTASTSPTDEGSKIGGSITKPTSRTSDADENRKSGASTTKPTSRTSHEDEDGEDKEPTKKSTSRTSHEDGGSDASTKEPKSSRKYNGDKSEDSLKERKPSTLPEDEDDKSGDSLKERKPSTLPEDEDDKSGDSLKERVPSTLPEDEDDKSGDSLKERGPSTLPEDEDDKSGDSLKERGPSTLPEDKNDKSRDSLKERKPSTLPEDEDDKSGDSLKERKPSTLPKDEDDKSGDSLKERGPSTLPEDEDDKFSDSLKKRKPSTLPEDEDDKSSDSLKKRKPSTLSEDEDDKSGDSLKKRKPSTLPEDEDDKSRDSLKKRKPSTLLEDEDDKSGDSLKKRKPSTLPEDEDDKSRDSLKERKPSTLPEDEGDKSRDLLRKRKPSTLPEDEDDKSGDSLKKRKPSTLPEDEDDESGASPDDPNGISSSGSKVDYSSGSNASKTDESSTSTDKAFQKKKITKIMIYGASIMLGVGLVTGLLFAYFTMNKPHNAVLLDGEFQDAEDSFMQLQEPGFRPTIVSDDK